VSDSFLRDLSPQRTAVLFWATLGLSVAAVLANLGDRWAWIILPALPIFVYGLLLWIAQQRYFVAHSPGVKNSPYVLGFAMTLVSLLSLFLRVGGELASGTVDPDLLVGQAGAAISTSIVGLLWRQALHTGDPKDAQQEELFRDLAKRLREHSLEFDNAQRNLVALIQEFVKAREELFSREEQAFQQFVNGMENGAQLLAQIHKTFPSRVSKVSEAFETALTRINEQVGASVEALTQLTETTRKGVSAVVGSSSEVVGSLRAAAAGWQEASQKLGDALTQHSTSFQGSIQTAEAAQTRLTALLQGFSQASERLQRLPDQLSTTLSNATSESVKLDSEVKQRLSALLEDLRAMDAIVDEVSRVLERRLEIAG
jgi:hypothetical protein